MCVSLLRHSPDQHGRDLFLAVSAQALCHIHLKICGTFSFCLHLLLDLIILQLDYSLLSLDEMLNLCQLAGQVCNRLVNLDLILEILGVR